MRRLLCVLLSLVVSSALVFAADGRIVGLVTDHNGDTLPGVMLKVHRRGVTRTTVADGQGRFAFSVPPGEYKLSAKLSGFKAKPLKVTVTTGETATPLVVMQIAVVGETVCLAARAPELAEEVRAAQR